MINGGWGGGRGGSFWWWGTSNYGLKFLKMHSESEKQNKKASLSWGELCVISGSAAFYWRKQTEDSPELWVNNKVNTVLNCGWITKWTQSWTANEKNRVEKAKQIMTVCIFLWPPFSPSVIVALAICYCNCWWNGLGLELGSVTFILTVGERTALSLSAGG